MKKNFLSFLILSGFIIMMMIIKSPCMFPQKKSATLQIEGNISIKIVFDNYQINPDLTTSWGFGCVIKTPGKSILFDTGGTK